MSPNHINNLLVPKKIVARRLGRQKEKPSDTRWDNRVLPAIWTIAKERGALTTEYSCLIAKFICTAGRISLCRLWLANDALSAAAISSICQIDRLVWWLGDAMQPFLIQYWHADHPPEYIERLIRSYRNHNEHMVHRVFNWVTAHEFIAMHLTERELSAFEACGVPAMQADYFRYCAMLKLAGVYSDAGMRCTGTLQPLIERAPSGLLVGRPNGIVINGFFLFKTPEHPLVRMALEVATVNIERKSSNDVWLTTGPGIFTLLACLRDAGSVGEFRSIYIDCEGPLTTLAQNICDVFKEDTCIESLFEGVVVLPSAELRKYVRGGVNLPYKTTAEHWVNWQARASIYAR